MIDEVKKKVFELMYNDNTGHGNDHINRVLKLSLKFAEKESVGVDRDVVSLIALLHDVDDYKLFGQESADKLLNAKGIMKEAKVNDNIQRQVLDALKTIGYSRLLKGIRPKSIEGKIVSDADMCDALGVNGILRINTYCTNNGKPFFDKNIFPIENITNNKYTGRCSDSSVCHMFEKILKLKNLMLTDSGQREALGRHKLVVEFLYQLFEEEDALEWTEYLDGYLANDC